MTSHLWSSPLTPSAAMSEVPLRRKWTETPLALEQASRPWGPGPMTLLLALGLSDIA